MIQKKEVGQVTPEERDQIKSLFERKNGLNELVKTLTGMSKDELDHNPLYNKVVEDIGRVSVQFQNWWNQMSKKYQWEGMQGYQWEIDFDTCKIYLTRQ